MGVNLCNLVRQSLLRYDTKRTKEKQQIKLDIIKIKMFAGQRTSSKLKDKLKNRRNLQVTYLIRNFATEIYKRHLQLNKTNNS